MQMNVNITVELENDKIVDTGLSGQKHTNKMSPNCQGP